MAEILLGRIKGDKGDPFEYDDFTPEQLEALKGEDGVTFTPSVDIDGNLTWTNDGGLDNPDPVNIKGDPFRYEDFTPEQLEALKGEDGVTPEKGVDYFTEADVQSMVDAVIAHFEDGDTGSY